MNIFYGKCKPIKNGNIYLKNYFDEKSKDFLDIYNDEIIDKELDLYIDDETLTKENELKLKYYLIYGDEKGSLKIINMLPFFQKNKIKHSDKREIQSSLNLYKKEDVNF